MDNNYKILVSGDVEGKFSQLFKRVATVNEKSGPFSMLLCVGEFFGHQNKEWNLYTSGKLKVPLPTYILGPVKKEMKLYYSDMRGCELAENLVYLGPTGIYPCSNGLRIAYLSGTDPKDHDSSNSNFHFDYIKKLEVSAGNKPKIDILISSEWPKGVCSYAKGPGGVDATEVGSLLVSRLLIKLKPRYHFAGLEGIFYERLPYRNHEVLKEAARNPTRFIALAKVGNPAKQKWLYAFNTTPIAHLSPSEFVSQPPDVTENPFPKEIVAETEKKYSKHQLHVGKTSQFFYDMKTQPEDDDDRGRKRKGGRNEDSGRKRGPPKPTGPCWFCLASPDVEKHLVVSVGTFSYLALAKGGLVPEHLLILPIEHFQSTSHLEDDIRAEIEKFKSTLVQMFQANEQTVVFFERNYKTQHLQIQVVPLPINFVPHLKETFSDVSESQEINLNEVPKHSDIAQLAPPGTPFFYVQLPTGEKLFHRIRAQFSLNFGRELLACPSLLNIPDRVNWRNCQMSTEEETELRSKVRKSYKPFDFTLDDDDDDDESD